MIRKFWLFAYMASECLQIPNNSVANYSWKPDHRNPEAAINFLDQVASDQQEQEEEVESFDDDGGGEQKSK